MSITLNFIDQKIHFYERFTFLEPTIKKCSDLNGWRVGMSDSSVLNPGYGLHVPRDIWNEENSDKK